MVEWFCSFFKNKTKHYTVVPEPLGIEPNMIMKAGDTCTPLFTALTLFTIQIRLGSTKLTSYFTALTPSPGRSPRLAAGGMVSVRVQG